MNDNIEWLDLLAVVAAIAVLLSAGGCKSRMQQEAVFEGAVETPTGEVYRVVLKEHRKGEEETEVLGGVGDALNTVAPLARAFGLPIPEMRSAPPSEGDNTTTWLTVAGATATAGYGLYEMLTKKAEQKKRQEAELREALRKPPPAQEA